MDGRAIYPGADALLGRRSWGRSTLLPGADVVVGEIHGRGGMVGIWGVGTFPPVHCLANAQVLRGGWCGGHPGGCCCQQHGRMNVGARC